MYEYNISVFLWYEDLSIIIYKIKYVNDVSCDQLNNIEWPLNEQTWLCINICSDVTLFDITVI